MAEKEIILFESADKSVSLSVTFENETVWLNRQQMASLFDRDVKTIGKHVKNAIEEELEGISVVANFATTASDGKTYDVEYYNLDVIISVGYRVKSKRGIEFRKWANSVLKQYILKGYAANDRRLAELRQTLQIIRRTENQLDTNQILSVIEQYTFALDLLDDYDHLSIKKTDGTSATYRITYEEARNACCTISQKSAILIVMQTRLSTKELIAASFMELAAQKPIDKITVREVAANCAITTVTFYNHFRDKYELLVWIYVNQAVNIMKKIGTGRLQVARYDI